MQLRKTQKEADAARLDAKAAELQLRLDRIDASESSSGSLEAATAFAPGLAASIGDHAPRRSPGLLPWNSWSDAKHIVQTKPQAALNRQEATAHRFDAAHVVTSPRRPHLEGAGLEKASGSSAASSSSGVNVTPQEKVETRTQAALETLAVDQDPETEDRPTRRRPAVFVSALVHVMLLVILACFTFSSHRPGDQVAIAGSVAETDEISIESLEIETAAMEPQEKAPTPTLAEYEVSDVGEIAVPDVTSDALAAAPAIEDMLSTSSSAAAKSLKSDSQATTQFCGVEGGGNHFVYLVDSSGSMGDAFESARQELLRSIDALGPKQRFYVIFFDSEPDYMRLASPNADETRSAYATPQNKRALARWATSIRMDRGRAPYDAIPFALKLRPDAIFLLSDGEFPQRIEELLQETNRIDNLFGDDGPISLVHTIGYHSREGENRMKRIAKQNGGQYRHVPKP
ncbi:MAG: hypothetical protein AAFU85_17000 [Planctomycetota bacterium]